MQPTRSGFYGVSAFRSFSTCTPTLGAKEFFVGINAEWPQQQPLSHNNNNNTANVQKKSTKPSDNIDLPEQHPAWRPADDGKTLSESEARIPQNEKEPEQSISTLPWAMWW